MQKFASINTKSPKESCPTDEELAAYIDGTLGKKDRERVAEHLASCEDCWAIYMGTVRFLLETEPAAEAEAAARNVVAFPSPEQRRHLWRWAAAAAGLLLVAGGGGGYYLAGPLPALVTAAVTPPVQNAAGLTGSLWRGPTYRGGGEEGAETPLDTASFQMGVQLVNLQATLAAGRGEDAQDIVARILTILKDQLFVQELTKGYTAITVAIENGTPPRTLAGQAGQLAAQAREVFDVPRLDFGQWVEASRLAALGGQASFFARGDSRAFLRRLLWRQKLGLGEMKLGPAIRQDLAGISDLLEKRSLDPTDYTKLSHRLTAILRIYYPES
jgi:hypothetical protein